MAKSVQTVSTTSPSPNPSWLSKSSEELTKILCEEWQLNELILVGKYINGSFVDVRTEDYIPLYFLSIGSEDDFKPLRVLTPHQEGLENGLYYASQGLEIHSDDERSGNFAQNMGQ